MRVIVGITGASGAQYAITLLENLKKNDADVGLVISEYGKEIIVHETPHSPEDVAKLADDVYDNNDLAASVSSGSQR
ncbi:MAG: hypothetical protein KAI64_01865, partial [Thermoplasmata archaeon]|nr:hypothetical protein [Thermoplasmata archaeon]